MDFIDDEDFVTTARREIFDTFPEFADVLDTGVGSPVDLENVHGITSCYLKAGRADIAGLMNRPFFTLESLGENAGGTGFPDTSGTGEKKGMGNPAGLNCILQSPTDMLLTDQIMECLWTPFSR